MWIWAQPSDTRTVVKDEWYVARAGEQFGPFTFERMRKGAREGELKQDDAVWCAGMPDWQLAADIASLWDDPEERPTTPPQVRENVRATPVMSEVRAPAGAINDGRPETECRPSRGFVRRHWRGQFTLAQAYWGVCVLLGLLAAGAGEAFWAGLEHANLPPVRLGLVLLGFLSFACAMTVWQLVGTWRAAGNHIRLTGRRMWAMAARLAILVAAVSFAAQFSRIIWRRTRDR
jgi:hypothetical protein